MIVDELRAFPGLILDGSEVVRWWDNDAGCIAARLDAEPVDGFFVDVHDPVVAAHEDGVGTRRIRVETTDDAFFGPICGAAGG